MPPAAGAPRSGRRDLHSLEINISGGGFGHWQAILDQDGVLEVHDLHVWTITSGRVMLSAHVVGRHEADRDRLILAVNRVLRERFGMGHTTLQVEGQAQAEAIRQGFVPACDSCVPGDETGEAPRSSDLQGRDAHP